MDLFPLYQEFVDKFYKEGYSGADKDHWMNSHFASAQKVKFDLFKRYGLIAAAGDRHLAEFMPHSWYLTNPKTVYDWKFHLTRVDWRMQHQQYLYEKSKRLNTYIEAITSYLNEYKRTKAIGNITNSISNVDAICQNFRAIYFPINVDEIESIREATISFRQSLAQHLRHATKKQKSRKILFKNYRKKLIN